MEILLLQWKPKNNGVRPQRLYRCLPEVRRRMQLMGSEIDNTQNKGGNFNIDLLNPNNHKITDEFINTVYSLSLFRKITRPSRITSHCATLIDDIFTSDTDDSTVSRLLIQ